MYLLLPDFTINDSSWRIPRHRQYPYVIPVNLTAFRLNEPYRWGNNESTPELIILVQGIRVIFKPGAITSINKIKLMKLILLVAAMAAVSFSASEVKGIDITVAKVATADLDYTCQATFDPALVNDITQVAAQDKYAWSWTTKTTEPAANDVFYSCIIASTHATNVIFGANTGTCYNATFGPTITATSWDSTSYVFNCTDKAVASSSLEGSTCKLYFNKGITKFEFTALADAKTLTSIMASNGGVGALSSTAGDYKKGQIVLPATGEECEDKSDAFTSTIAGAASLVAAASFF